MILIGLVPSVLKPHLTGTRLRPIPPSESVEHQVDCRFVTEPTSKDASCKCEEDRTLRALLVGMLREDAGTKPRSDVP
jgi:hypothetical protein